VKTAMLVLSCVLCVPLAAKAADPLPRAKPESVGMSSERLALIRKQIDAEIARDQLPGAVLVIARRGKLVHFEAYGYLDKVAAAVLAGLTADSISFVVRSWLWEASEAIRAIEAAVAVEHEGPDHRRQIAEVLRA
jgi:hypothetical protein